MNVKLTVVDVDPSSKADSAQGSVLCHLDLLSVQFVLHQTMALE